MKRNRTLITVLCMMLGICGCTQKDISQEDTMHAETYTLTSTIGEVIHDPVFEDHGRLLFPVDMNIPLTRQLQDLDEDLIWYHNVDPDRTVSIVNELHEQAQSGRKIFYDIYTDEEKEEDPSKEDTGLFFFKGDPGADTAIINAGGGFVYVAAMHDSFPQAQVLAQKGYNAFALIYRPGADTACEDLAQAIVFLYEHAEELEINMDHYSLWGGSAGARMAAWLGAYGTASFGERSVPAPAAVIMQYTGLSQITGKEPPTYACVGTRDGIASYRGMENYINRIRSNGIPAEIEIFNGLQHGFGLGEGTAAEGWIDHAVYFWEENISE